MNLLLLLVQPVPLALLLLQQRLLRQPVWSCCCFCWFNSACIPRRWPRQSVSQLEAFIEALIGCVSVGVSTPLLLGTLLSLYTAGSRSSSVQQPQCATQEVIWGGRAGAAAHASLPPTASCCADQQLCVGIAAPPLPIHTCCAWLALQEHTPWRPTHPHLPTPSHHTHLSFGVLRFGLKLLPEVDVLQHRLLFLHLCYAGHLLL